MHKKIIISLVAPTVLCFTAIMSLAYKTSDYDRVTAIAGDFDPIVVLALFTSQGCSSCPPAV